MLDRLLRLVSPYLLPVLAALLAAAIGWGLVQTLRMRAIEAELVEERLARAEETAMRERVAREAEARIATLQAEHARAQQESTRAFNQEIAARDAAAAAAAADADRLRRDLEEYAAGRGGGTGPDAAACGDLRDRTASLGRLLARADRVAQRLAGAAERHASEVRALQRQLTADRAACGGAP